MDRADPDISSRQLLQSLSVGVALVDPADWAVLFENARFFQWFPPAEDADQPLEGRMAGLKADRARQRLEQKRPFAFETETESNGRTIPVSVELRPYEDDGRMLAMVECRDISKQQEIQYMLDSYSELAERNTRELQKEKERVEKLLLNIMPRSVYEEMKDFGTATPQRFDNATILMLDFVDFTEMAVARDPSALVAELNDIFSAFDRIVELFGCERIKTIGDAYMAVSGLPEAAPEHAQNIARVALRMRRYLERRNAAHPAEWLCRIGINSGPVIGSIVGIQKYVYDIFGPGVNLAARLEALCDPMRILVSEETYLVIRNEFNMSERGAEEIKGFGTRKLYYLDGEHRR